MKFRTLAPLILTLAGFGAYFNSLQAPFIFDDLKAIPENGSIRSLWPLGKVLRPPPYTAVAARPVSNLTLAINYAIGGLDVRGYHFLNIALHVLAGLTLYGIARRTFLTPPLASHYGDDSAQLAFAIALLWMLHPLHTEVVTYVTTRTESLMAVFFLLTLYCVIRGATSEQGGAGGIWYAAAVCACALGMGSKEVMIVAPVIVLIYDRIFLEDSWKQVARRRAPLYAGLFATWVLLVYIVFSYARLRFRGDALQHLTIADNLKTQAGVLVEYLRLAVWPSKLVLDYYDWTIVRDWGAAILPGLLIFALLVLTIWALVRRPPLGFLGVWFFVILSPTSSFYPMPVEVATERRMYLPLAAIVALVVIAAWEIFLWRFRRGMLAVPTSRAVGAVCLTVAAVALGFLTIQRNQDYATEVAIWTDTVEKRPANARARNNLAVALAKTGRKEEARRQLMQIIVKRPDYAGAYNNLGNLQNEEGNIDDAAASYAKAIELLPTYADAHVNLGWLLASQNRTPEAVQYFAAAVHAEPDHAAAHHHLADALAMLGHTHEAVDQYEQTLKLQPDRVEALKRLSWILATNRDPQVRDPDRAIVLAKQARKLTKSRQSEPLDTLAAAYAQVGRFDEATATAQKALDLAKAAGDANMASAIERRIALYANKQPYIQGAGASTGKVEGP